MSFTLKIFVINSNCCGKTSIKRHTNMHMRSITCEAFSQVQVLERFCAVQFSYLQI
uniref:Uncharacterized protein n=1 Tax=Rhizophora mucronata TaxID=61149 RepID=A0A2P2NEP9_RHIMU